MQFVWKQSRHSKNYIVRYNATLLELLQRKFVKRKYDRYAKESVNSYTQRYNAKWNELHYATEAEHTSYETEARAANKRRICNTNLHQRSKGRICKSSGRCNASKYRRGTNEDFDHRTPQQRVTTVPTT